MQAENYHKSSNNMARTLVEGASRALRAGRFCHAIVLTLAFGAACAAGVVDSEARTRAAASADAAAEQTGRSSRTYSLPVVRVATPPEIDGKIDERIWRRAPMADDFRVAETNVRARERTEVRVVADLSTLYFAFVNHDSRPREISATRVERYGSLALDDQVIVELVPAGAQRGVRFAVNAEGVQADDLPVASGRKGAWRAAVDRTGRGWTAEFAIPLSTLTFERGATDIGVNFSRYHHRTTEWSAWVAGAPGAADAMGLLTDLFATPAASALAQPRAQAPVEQARQQPVAPSAPRAVPPPPPAIAPYQVPAPPPPLAVPSVSTGPVLPTDPFAPAGMDEEYVLQRGDVIDVKHFNNPELDQSIPIRPDGAISLPLAGNVRAAGLTASELQVVLTQRYAASLRAPEVAVLVKGFGGNRVYIGGEVTRPGVLQTTGTLTVLQAVMEAGGFTRAAELRNVVILRNQGTSQPAFMSVNLKRSMLVAGQANDLVLKPYDIVFVPKTRIAHLDDLVDQYVNQLLPAPLNLGLSYILLPRR